MILVCGGAGYIGSHMVHELVRRGEEALVLDNLRSGHRAAVHPKARFVQGDIRDRAVLDNIFSRHDIEAVIHFAASSLVGESVVKPLEYFDNNVGGMQSLLAAMAAHGRDKLVFSSTAAVYGEPERVPILEDDPTRPTNPYGESKLIMEKMMQWVSQAHGVRFVSLRYFNVAGALPDGSLGEDHRPETHLIPLILQVPLGRRARIGIFGDDYDTPDGTCIRDYIHVMDLTDAHQRAIDHLRRGGEGGVFNLGSAQGFSVREMISAAERVVGRPIPTAPEARRAGDPARLVASAAKAAKILGWQPRYTSIEDVISTAWAWHQSHPDGYAE
ncbi:MAG: UDP-glucose 4-epimerase GalE [Candidatus Adiutrix sp.]|jgi:UDP-glucose 4-epimerase|nr:UDP-glucose 4-epimerase GalE [Candidatus Adiutrix sp.]